MVSHRLIDLTGKRFGMLKVKRRHKRKGATYWLCKCDCGRSKVINGTYLKNGEVDSCGCKDGTEGKFLKHGMSYAPEYRTWGNMLTRCYNPKSESYRYYGKLGVTVCERWRKSFQDFFEDMGKKPSPTHSIERIKTTGNYDRFNCKWATRKEQNQNKRKSIWLNVPGKGKMCLRELCKISGICYQTLLNRYKDKPNNIEYILADFNLITGKEIRVTEEAKKIVETYLNG